MANREKTNDVETEKTVQKQGGDNYGFTARRWLVPGLVIIIVLMFIALISAFWWTGKGGRLAYRDYKFGPMPMRREAGLFGSGGGYRYVSNQNQTRGVVTAVNGSSFTVAAYGSTTTVQTSSATQYHGGDQVKVNDTVIAYGAGNNGTLNATQVVINP